MVLKSVLARLISDSLKVTCCPPEPAGTVRVSASHWAAMAGELMLKPIITGNTINSLIRDRPRDAKREAMEYASY